MTYPNPRQCLDAAARQAPESIVELRTLMIALLADAERWSEVRPPAAAWWGVVLMSAIDDLDAYVAALSAPAAQPSTNSDVGHVAGYL